MNYYVERYYPLGITILATALLYKYKCALKSFDILIPNLTSNALTLSGTLLGFLLTLLTLLGTINTRRMNFVKDNLEAYELLQKYLNVAIISNIAVLVAAFVLMIIDRNCVNAVAMLLMDFAFIFLIILALLMSIRFALIFITLMKDKKTPKP